MGAFGWASIAGAPIDYVARSKKKKKKRERERERERPVIVGDFDLLPRERERESERESRKMEPEAWRQFFDLLLMKYSYIIDDEVLLMKYSCIPPTESCSTTSPLTVANLKNHVDACGLSKKIELVIVSPLLRTMQTAVGVFGGEGYMDGIDIPPLMVANAGKSSHPAISSLNCPPFIAVELCRERLGVNPCDRRRSISEYKSIFPAIDFSMIESDADILWKPGPREKDEQLAARGMKFLNWLWTRPEKEIVVVTHSAFLVETLSAFGNDCHPSIKSEICKSFNNCELRSLVIVDKGMLGSDSSTTNYPGKIPSGADLPSDVAKEKHPASGVPT